MSHPRKSNNSQKRSRLKGWLNVQIH